MYNHDLDKKPEQTTFNSMYRGEVVNNVDPSQNGRCQIRIFGVYDNIDDELLPWALYSDPFMSNGFFIPDIGAHVWCFFENGNHMYPVYFAGAPAKPHLPEEKSTSTHEESQGDIVYPKNRAIVTKAGHKIEMDDSDDNPRISIIHASGSQVTFQANGDVYEHITGNYKRVIDGSIEQTITGDVTTNYDGKLTVNVGADYMVSSGGNLILESGGNIDIISSGNVVVQGATIQLN